MRQTDSTAIRVESLVKHFGAVEAVRGISFTVARGATCALLGGNGAGKTTTLSMLMGLLSPTAGKVTILDHDIAIARYSVLPRMNFTSPYADLPKRLTVRENLTVFAGLYNLVNVAGRIDELATDYALSGFIDRPYGNLSAGQRTRVAVAKALLNRPEVLLLDEPTASLDPDAGDLVRAHLTAYQRASGATFLLASHNMVEVERMASDVLMMRSGRIVDSGTPSALVARHGRSNMEEVFLHIARNGDAAPEQ